LTKKRNETLAGLIRISNVAGADAALVQAGGGNTSAKTADGRYMYIKASGTALKDMNEHAGWRRMRLEPVLSIISDRSLSGLDTHERESEVVNRLLRCCDDGLKTSARPSVEAHLHAFLGAYVIHLHPSAVGAYVNAKHGKKRLEQLFENVTPPFLWVPYTDPGYMLARKISRLVERYRAEFKKPPQVMFLEKHGLIVSAETPDAALRLVRKVIRLCSQGLPEPKTPRTRTPDQRTINDAKLCIRAGFFKATGQHVPVHFFRDEQAVSIMSRPAVSRLLSAPALTPDELLYSNGPALWVERVDAEKLAAAIKAKVNKGHKPPLAFLVKRLGLFTAGGSNISTVIREIQANTFFIRPRAWQMGGIQALNQREQDVINNWESEAFRRRLASAESAGELAGRIGVVSGAGSGLGRSIAIGIACAGALVAVADIDEAAAKETCELIKKQSQTETLVAACDVTHEASVDHAFEAVLDRFGGLDILVNAAGVAPAAPLVEMEQDQWRFALEVNLTGYFLMARAAARILIEQGIGGSIINISSKSGLQASTDNTAYNATKAGELHMARGWALELGEHQIRVNSICPGNVFEGSKIWNRRYIRACAKKYGIKPDEVISFYVNRTSLKSAITGADIAESVVFLCSDRASKITGQTLVADAGQVMVR